MEYLDFDEAVLFLKTTPSTLYKWLQAEKIPGHKLGRQWRFLKDELELHVSGKAQKINLHKDVLRLSELLLKRSKLTKEDGVEQLNINKISEQIIWDAFDHGSRLIHMYPSKGKYEISYRSRSGLEKLSDIQEESFIEINQSLLEASSPIGNEASRRLYLHREKDKKQSDVLQIKYQKIETVTGARVTLRLWQPEQDVPSLDKIISQPKALAHFQNWLKLNKGILLVSGASGSGKTTTVYSLLNEFKNKDRVVFTIEDSVDVIIEGLNQIEIKGKDVNQFDDVFEKVYGSDPDVICLGLGSYLGLEEKVFNAAYRAASTGHLVIIQMDQPSCDDALNVFKKFISYPVDHLIAGISCQKLVEEKGHLIAVFEFK
ncbi:MAG: Flp pilus assembly complex ATPase component TadA [Bdellovibrionaceae bacterium]|nr:Flp pilus assembly complex ATPase component TadA [Pseudobdellovibrionaceae bacterium]